MYRRLEPLLQGPPNPALAPVNRTLNTNMNAFVLERLEGLHTPGHHVGLTDLAPGLLRPDIDPELLATMDLLFDRRIEIVADRIRRGCPVCDGWSERMHSSYLRFPVDLPTAGQRVVVSLRVRRFLCRVDPCARRTFVEQIPGLTRRHGRWTERLRAALGSVGLALAGRAGARGWPDTSAWASAV